METSCLELALEGERLCKAGDYVAGVSCFESAIQVGTEDLQILSAIYSQLGNAYFHLQDYRKALEYHHHDLILTRTIGDELGEAKASGNLGNTLKVLGQFDEAVVCCQRHLDITRSMYDKVGQTRALYNFGNVYHAKGKSLSWNGADPGDFPDEARIALKKATEYYESNLSLVKEIGDQAAQGRTYGNLGNTHYLLGNFSKAAAAHEKRLLIAKEFGDKSAERRAHCNLGNAHIFLGQFEMAVDNYKRTLQLARQMKDRAVEAQACYSLGNTYTLLQDYERAINYHLKHLIIAQDLKDRVGEGRACWSLGNAHTALGNHDEALNFAERHLEISKEIGDKSGEVTARMNMSDLRLVLGLQSNSNARIIINPSTNLNTNTNSSVLVENHKTHPNLPDDKSQTEKRNSMGTLEQLRISPDKNAPDNSQDLDEDVFTESPKSNMAKVSSFIHRLRSKKLKNSSQTKEIPDSSNKPSTHRLDAPKPAKPDAPDTVGDDGFFDLLTRFQGSRMDDQRCSLLDGPLSHSIPSSPRTAPPVEVSNYISGVETSPKPGHVLDLVATSQGRQSDDHRASVSSLPGLLNCNVDQPQSPPVLNQLVAGADQPEGDDDFFDMLIKCQGSRLNDQRCAVPPPTSKGPTVPSEDFFSLILHAQTKRMDGQRVLLPSNSASNLNQTDTA